MTFRNILKTIMEIYFYIFIHKLLVTVEIALLLY